MSSIPYNMSIGVMRNFFSHFSLVQVVSRMPQSGVACKMASPLNEEIKKKEKEKGDGEGEKQRGSSMECFEAGRCNGTCSVAVQHVPRKVNTQISRAQHDQRCDTDSNNHFSFFSWWNISIQRFRAAKVIYHACQEPDKTS